MNVATRMEETVFDAARKLTDPAQRKAFLDQACSSDPDLRSRVEELLGALGDAEQFFADSLPALRLPADEMQTFTAARISGGVTDGELSADEQPGTRIGPYKILQKIGEGGCGSVYMAGQEEPVRRRVALKVIKLGMDTKRVIARFEAERQALAMMDHPNIARVLDAGATNTGRPYFVMELVRGVKITDYCDQNHLDTRQRLDLFIQICHAIQHAHQKGIIHRDIKPSNILVTLHDGVPVPKVIDFGIAKATSDQLLTDKTLFTAYDQFVGTPAYMSPEQAEMSGLDVDTRSDIYSLGVLLYELLTGKTPFDSKELLRSGLDEMRRTLRETEPHRPSTKLNTLRGAELTATATQRHSEPPKLKSQLRGDIDWIVMKALEKDRTRRYETANGLAMDIQRHLHNEPVVARPPSRLYRFQKLVRRNKVIFAAGGAVAAALIIGLGASTWLFLKEREAHQRAIDSEQQQARLRQQAETKEKITQTAFLVNQGRFVEADKLAGEIPRIRPTVEGAAAFRALGEWHVLQSRWAPAAERFAVLVQINEYDGWDVSTLDFLERGTSLIECGDMAGYEQFHQVSVTRFAGTTNPVVAERIVKINLLLPADQAVIGPLLPLSGLAVKSFANLDSPGVETFQAAWGSVSVALMEYRQGNYARAVNWCQRCLACPDFNPARSATAHVLLSMSRHQLHQSDEARAELAQGREMIESTFKSGLERGNREDGFWFDWVFAHILLREAEGLIQGTPASTSAVNQTGGIEQSATK